MIKGVKFVSVLLPLLFCTNALSQNFSDFEKHIDVEYLAKSAFVRLYNGNNRCQIPGVKISDLKGFQILDRYRSIWENADTKAPGHGYKVKLVYYFPKAKTEFSKKFIEFYTFLDVIAAKTPNKSLLAATKANTRYEGHLHQYINRACPKHVWGQSAKGPSNVKSILKVQKATLEYIYLDKPRQYRGNQYVFAAQKILADTKFQLLGNKDVDGLFGPKTLEAFELFMALTDAQINFDGKTFNADLVAKMKSAYEAY